MFWMDVTWLILSAFSICIKSKVKKTLNFSSDIWRTYKPDSDVICDVFCFNSNVFTSGFHVTKVKEYKVNNESSCGQLQTQPVRPKIPVFAWGTQLIRLEVAVLAWGTQPVRPKIPVLAWGTQLIRLEVPVLAWCTQPVRPKVVVLAWGTKPVIPKEPVLAWGTQPVRPKVSVLA